MKYTVTIKDNESGETLRNIECNAIIAGVSFNEEMSASIGISNCNGAELLGACKSAKKAIYNVIKDDPAIKILFALYEMKLLAEMSGEEQEEEDDNNE